MQHFLRVFRIGAVVLPVVAGLGYGVIYGMDFWFKLGCRGPAPLDVFHLSAAAWLILAVCQIAGYRARLGWLDIWKVVVIGVSVVGIDACRELLFLPPLWDNCQNIGLYDYADDFLGVGMVWMMFVLPATVISAVIALFAVIKWQFRKDLEKAFR